MDFKFSKDSDDRQPPSAPAEKKNQSALLVLLLVLVGGFLYLYFFTGLIRPQGVSQPIPAPAAAPQTVKMPLPPRLGETAPDAADKPDAHKTVVPLQAEAPKGAQTAAVAIPSPAAPPTVPKQESKTAVPAKSAGKKPLPPAPGGTQEPKAVTANKGVPSADKKVASATPAAKTASMKSSATSASSTAKPAAAAKTRAKAARKGGAAKREAGHHAGKGTWIVQVGNYVLEEALSADLGRVRKAGFTPVIKAAARKKIRMNRLLLSEFSERAAARSAFDRLKSQTSDAFMVDQNGKFAVYAGSYLLAERAASEKDRLTSKGFPVTLKRFDVAIPAQSLSVGPFNSKKAADAAVGTLKGAGIKASLTRL